MRPLKALLPLLFTALAMKGDATYYTPGLGACGYSNTKGEMVAALSSTHFSPSDHCGKQIKINGDNGAVTAKVVDLCPGCDSDNVDLSPAAFKKAVGGLGVGRAEVNWSWA